MLSGLGPSASRARSAKVSWEEKRRRQQHWHRGRQQAGHLTLRQSDAVVSAYRPFMREVLHRLVNGLPCPVDELHTVGEEALRDAAEQAHVLGRVGALQEFSFEAFARVHLLEAWRLHIQRQLLVRANRPKYRMISRRLMALINQARELVGQLPNPVQVSALLAPVDTVGGQGEPTREPLDELDQLQAGDPFLFAQEDGLLSYTEACLALAPVLRRLNPPLRDVVEMTYFEGLSQSKIAVRLGISQMQVSRRLRQGLYRLHVLLTTT